MIVEERYVLPLPPFGLGKRSENIEKMEEEGNHGTDVLECDEYNFILIMRLKSGN